MNTLPGTRLVTSRLMLIAILAISGLLAIVSAVLFQAPGVLGRDKGLTDFDAFHIAGTLAARGSAVDAYQVAEMVAAQRTITGTAGFMPWTYPPPYTLLMEGLAWLPIGSAYLLFIATGYLFYLLVLRQIAGAYLPGVLIAIAPTIFLMVRTGQNGFLTGGLVGAFLLAFQGPRAVAGVPLGLMCIKPHLAVGIALLALLGRRWMAMAIAAGVVAAAMLVATLAYGTVIWSAFFGSVRDASHFLEMGYYPLFRMSSVYASVRSFGGPASLALTIHIIVALAAIGALVHLWRRGCHARILAASTCTASLFVSPYSYDYDLTILGLAIAFLLPDLIARARQWELAALLGLSWLTTGYGLALSILIESSGGGVVSSLRSDGKLALIAPALLILAAASIVILRRTAPPTSTEGPQPVLADQSSVQRATRWRGWR